MARYGKESKLSVDQVLEKAREFFGPGGVGLEIKDQGQGCAHFEGGGGHVAIDGCSLEKGSEITLETREWDYQVKKFLKKI